MKKVSIKTVDGNRYDYLCDQDNFTESAGDDVGEWFSVIRDGVTRLFFKKNIVSITIRDADNA